MPAVTHNRLLGTSAGAITATLLAAGYSAEEMLEVLAEKKDGRSVFSDFMGNSGSFGGSVLVKNWALANFLSEIDIPFIPDAVEKGLDQVIINWMASRSKAN